MPRATDTPIQIIAYDAIALSYFASTIYFAAGTGQEDPLIEEGESVKVVGTPETDADGRAWCTAKWLSLNSSRNQNNAASGNV